MIETILHAFVTMFVVIDPVGLLPVYIGLTQGTDAAHKRTMAIRGILIGGAILFFFALVGDALLEALGIGLAAFRAAGGAMLFLIAIEMVFERRGERREHSAEEMHKEVAPDDISVFPLAIPLISGPGAIASIMLLMSGSQGDRLAQGAILAVLAGILLTCLVLFLAAPRLERVMGKTLTNVFSRLLGILLGALAVQYLFDGIRQALLS